MGSDCFECFGGKKTFHREVEFQKDAHFHGDVTVAGKVTAGEVCAAQFVEVAQTLLANTIKPMSNATTLIGTQSSTTSNGVVTFESDVYVTGSLQVEGDLGLDGKLSLQAVDADHICTSLLKAEETQVGKSTVDDLCTCNLLACDAKVKDNLEVSGDTALTNLNVTGHTTVADLEVTGPATLSGPSTLSGTTTVDDLCLQGNLGLSSESLTAVNGSSGVSPSLTKALTYVQTTGVPGDSPPRVSGSLGNGVKANQLLRIIATNGTVQYNLNLSGTTVLGTNQSNARFQQNQVAVLELVWNGVAWIILNSRNVNFTN